MNKSSLSIDIDLKLYRALQKTLVETGKVPQKNVNKAAGKGANVVRRAIRKNTPVGDTGELKRGIVRNGERSKYKGKKVYDLMFDPAKNHIFQKPIPAPGTKNPGTRRRNWKHAYYPASMEYGFLTRSKGGGYDYVPGYYFMRDATKGVYTEASKEMIDHFCVELEKEWSKK